jgi:Leucine-rich repeat (LRR) protein
MMEMSIKSFLIIAGIFLCYESISQGVNRYQGPRYFFFDDFSIETLIKSKDSLVDKSEIIALEVTDADHLKRLSEYKSLQYLSLVNIEIDSNLKKFGYRLEFIEIKQCTFNDYSIFEKIKAKDLFSINIEGTIVNDFSWLSSFNKLKVLNVEGSNLKTIPQELSRNNSLESINLSRNNIDSLKFESFKSKYLKYLSFRNNALKVIEPLNGYYYNLEIIDLTCNENLTNESVCQLQDYEPKKIILESCGLNEFPTCLVDNCRLEELSLENNSIRKLPDRLERPNKCKDLWILLFGNSMSDKPKTTQSNIVILSNVIK